MRLALALALGVPAIATAAVASPASALARTGDPARNRSPSPAATAACGTNPAGGACITAALADINAAHAAEGVRPLVLPNGFASLPVPVQLLDLADQERVDRGLAPVVGLSAALDTDAQTAAAQDQDPMPSAFYGNAATGNWAGGVGSTLEADFLWMYDDGLGSNNLDCTTRRTAGCWGHRHDILWPFTPPVVMGAASAPGRWGVSLTEVFVGGDTRTGPGQPDAPIVRPGSVPSPAVATRTASDSRPGRCRLRVLSVQVTGQVTKLAVRCAGRDHSSARMTATLVAVGPRRPAHAAVAARTKRRRSRSVLARVTRVVSAGGAEIVRLRWSRSAARSLGAGRTLHSRLVVSQAGRASVLVDQAVTLPGG